MALPSRVPVLIAGGGPVGLAAAMELSLHGIGSAVLEPRRDVSWLRPRAKTVSARTMEHFRRWGLAQRLRERAPLAVGWSNDVVFCTTVTGREVTRFHDCFGLGLAHNELVAEAGQQAPQPLVEQILREAVGDSRYASLVTGWRVTAVTQAGEIVRVTAEDGDGRPATVEASYVIGCDGARSVVRDAIGARFDGSADGRLNVNVTFRAPGLADQVPHGPAVQYWVLNPEQPGIVGRLDLAGTWWCIANGVGQAAAEADPGFIVRAMTGSDVPVEALATDAWTARMQLADRYSRGRMFIAGDAAHQNPPYGGHGFNTGVGDAVNIGWKLAAVLNGWAPTALLESYEAERRPVAAVTVAEAASNMATLATELADPRLVGADEEFAAVLSSARAAIHRTKDREFHSLDLVLGYSYRESPITVPDGTGPPGAAGRSGSAPAACGAGERLPHRWAGAGDSLYDHLGPEFTLIRCTHESGPGTGAGARAGAKAAAAAGPGACSGAAAEQPDGGLTAAARDCGIPLTVLELGGPGWELGGPGWAAHFGAALVLVRPDQHVSWSGNAPADARRLLRAAVGW